MDRLWYTISGFDVTGSYNNFRLSNAPSLNASLMTLLLKNLPESVKPIPNECSLFVSIISFANELSRYNIVDILGEVSSIWSTINDRKQRIMLTLCLESDVPVVVSMFYSLAVAFHNKFESYGSEPRIVLATSINPRMGGGRLYLNSTSGTHSYFDSETAVEKEMLEKLASTASKVVHAQKIEPLTVSALNEYVITANPKITEFLCTAKVNEIHADRLLLYWLLPMFKETPRDIFIHILMMWVYW
ncbi:hypothetical protein HID58_066927, partial [Brassica napus]